MGYIYKITNTINDKVYIGKTQRTIQERWQGHIKDSWNSKYQHRPLYRAFKKYGLNSFSIEIIEECENNQLNDKEKFWIKQYDSFKNGYNATLGGDGGHYGELIDRQQINDLWKKGLSLKQICNQTHHERHQISAILKKELNVPEKDIIERSRNKKLTAMIDPKTDEIINIFESATSAAKFLGKNNGNNITSVCRKKSKTAYGYKWEYLI